MLATIFVHCMFLIWFKRSTHWPCLFHQTGTCNAIAIIIGKSLPECCNLQDMSSADHGFNWFSAAQNCTPPSMCMCAVWVFLPAPWIAGYLSLMCYDKDLLGLAGSNMLNIWSCLVWIVCDTRTCTVWCESSTWCSMYGCTCFTSSTFVGRRPACFASHTWMHFCILLRFCNTLHRTGSMLTLKRLSQRLMEGSLWLQGCHSISLRSKVDELSNSLHQVPFHCYGNLSVSGIGAEVSLVNSVVEESVSICDLSIQFTSPLSWNLIYCIKCMVYQVQNLSLPPVRYALGRSHQYLLMK